MTPTDVNAVPRRGFLRNSHLWLLAAILGAGTVHAVMTAVHDTTQRRAAAGIVTRAMAERVAASAERRFELAAAVSFAPVLSGNGASDAQRLVDELALQQATSERCECRPTLPVSGFFAADVAADSITLALRADGATPTVGMRSALEAIVRSVATAETASRAVSGPRGSATGPGATGPGATGSLPIALHFDASLGSYAAITFVRRESGGAPSGVAGMLVAVPALMDELFGDVTAPAPDLESGSDDARMAVLDSTSLEVRTADGRITLGGTDAVRRFRATVQPSGALHGLMITVALTGYEIAPPLLSPIRTPQLWYLAALIVVTFIVVVIAVRASTRETQLARARSDFIAGVSHELRMPLAQILLASETLAMQRERNEVSRVALASSIVREARRLIGMVENVLLFSRTGAVQLRPHLDAVLVADLFADAVEAVELAVADAGQRIEVAAPASMAVRADRTLTRQALVNLVDNAIKYGSTGQCIRLMAEQPSPERVRLVVEDEGRGIPDAERSRVFEPYQRLDRDQSSERTGTGLGLAVVRQIAAASSGRIWLDAGARGGTRAILELPTAAPSVAPARPVVA